MLFNYSTLRLSLIEFDNFLSHLNEDYKVIRQLTILIFSEMQA